MNNTVKGKNFNLQMTEKKTLSPNLKKCWFKLEKKESCEINNY